MLERARTVVMWNPSSRFAARAVGVQAQLGEMANVAFRRPNDRDAAIREVVDLCNSDLELLIAAGGDGTISSVVEGMMKSQRRPILGILPLGTGNDLARTLDIPLAPDGALEVLRSNQVREIDLVRCRSSQGLWWYTNMVTAGNTGRYLEQMTDDTKHRWGPFCYLRGALDLIQELQVYRIEVSCDDGPAEPFEALNLFVANGRTSGGGMLVSPEAALDDGLVDLVIVRNGDPAAIAGLTAEYVISEYMQNELIEFRRVRRIALTAEPPLPLTADGETVGRTPLSIEVRQQCIRVVAPVADTATAM